MPDKRTPEERAIVRQAREHRPKCRCCGKRMEPCYERKWGRVDTPDGFHSTCVIVGVRYYGYNADQLFCSLRCGFVYGTRVARLEDSRRR